MAAIDPHVLQIDRADTDATLVGQPMVRAEQVWKRFGKLEVLKGIDLEVMPQQTYVLLGPSGGGKSTLLRCINHLEKINAGRLWVAGELIGYRQKGDSLHEMKARDVATSAFARRHGLPALQPVPAHDRPRERHRSARSRAAACRASRPKRRLSELLAPRRPGREARHLPGPALRRPAAARGHRPGAGHGAQAHALRRAHLGARPRAGGRGPRRDEAARPGRHDHGRGHPRDGLRQGGRRRRGSSWTAA